MANRYILGKEGYLDTSKPTAGEEKHKQLKSNNNTYSKEFLDKYHQDKELQQKQGLKPKM